jgi:hypothetical protein
MNQDRNKAWGFALFGDDVRAEIGGKLSLMGLYQADMFFPDSMRFPIGLPKLVILIMYYEIQGSLQEDFSFRITYGAENNLLAEIPVSRSDIVAGQAQAPVPEEDDPSERAERIFNMRMPVVLSPFSVDKMGRLRVRAHYSDGKILKLGSIGLKQIPEIDFQNMLGIKPAQ